MRKSRMKMIAAVFAATLLLGGCGEAPYELTQSEESLIVNYSAHVVSKFNIKQKDGLTYVSPSKLQGEEETETELPEEEPVMDTETPEEGESADANAGAGEQPNEEAVDPGKTLQDVFGIDGLSIAYQGYDVKADCVEEDYYSLNAPAGDTYVIMKISLTNSSGQDIAFDNLSKKALFKADIDGTEAKAQTTILLTDFSTYQGTISAGQTVDTVLIFEVKEETAANITNIGLNVTLNGEKIPVIL